MEKLKDIWKPVDVAIVGLIFVLMYSTAIATGMRERCKERLS